MGHGEDRHLPWVHGPRGRHGSRVAAWVAVGVASVLVAGLLVGYVAFRDVFGKIHQVSVSDLGKRPPKFNNSQNILVIGSDTRKGKNDVRRAHRRAAVGHHPRPAPVPRPEQAVVISIPRDSVVPVLNCPRWPARRGRSPRPDRSSRSTRRSRLGGPGCLWKTIEQTTHIRLDHFMELNFTGFESVINDLGGVRICLPFAISDPRSRLRLTSGIHHVWGAQALAYWRVRYIGLGSDLERIQRDQFLMASVAQEIKRSNLLGNPARLFKVVSDIAASLTTDNRLSQGATDLAGPGAATAAAQSGAFRAGARRGLSAESELGAVGAERGDAVQGRSPTTGSCRRSRQRAAGHHVRAQDHTARPEASNGSASPGPAESSPEPLSHLSRKFGGITAHANVCRDCRGVLWAAGRALLAGRLDHRRAAGLGEPPDRAQGDRLATARVGPPALGEAAEPGPERAGRALPEHGERDPVRQVDDGERPGQVPAGEPDPVPRLDPVPERMPGVADRGWHMVACGVVLEPVAAGRSAARTGRSPRARRRTVGQLAGLQKADRRIAQAPPAKVVTAEDRSGSPTRSLGTWRRAPAPPSGSSTRNEMTASIGSAAKRRSGARRGRRPDTSRRRRGTAPRRPWLAPTPALRPPATPTFSASRISVTAVGQRRRVGAVADDDSSAPARAQRPGGLRSPG